MGVRDIIFFGTYDSHLQGKTPLSANILSTYVLVTTKSTYNLQLQLFTVTLHTSTTLSEFSELEI